MAETKEGLFDTAARAVKAAIDSVLGKTAENTKLAADPQSLKTKDGDPIEVDADGNITSGQADGEYVLEDGSTATIKDGKLGEVKPAETDKPAEDAKTEDAPAETDKSEEKPEDKPVTQADLKPILDAIAALQAAVAADKEDDQTELSAQVTKLAAELEEVKRQPAVGKQGPPTYSGEQVDLSKMSVADRAAYAARNASK